MGGSKWVSDNAYCVYIVKSEKCVVFVKEKVVHIQRLEITVYVELRTTDTCW